MPNKLERYYYEARENKWYRYFAVFCRFTLAIAWIISGIVKIRGERFAAGLSHNHPLGQYFDALLNTGYYYTFIGVGQVIIAILLLIPRTALLGAISSFPIILNICVLTYSVRFEGTRAATFMLLANIFLLCWDYDRLKSILPFRQVKIDANPTNEKRVKDKFPFLFFGGVVATLATVVFLNNVIYDIRPGNEPAECWNGCPGNSSPKACEEFCDCIHNKGKPLGKCLEDYEKAKEREKKDSVKTTFVIPKGYVGMFGYGSLMSKKFIETGLIAKNYDGPFLSAHLKGYKRSWTFAWPSTIPSPNSDGNYYKDYILVQGDTIYPKNLLYLNIKEDTSSVINGVLYMVPEKDLPTYDAWELGYERFEVTDLINDYSIEGGPVFAYKALPDFVLEPNNDYKRNIIELSYYKIIQDALHYWGKEFEAEYKQSTMALDTTIVKGNQKILWSNPPLDKMKQLKSSFKYNASR